ncbi:MAG: hypothetical protein ACLPSW_29700 [Roseiarcus sp.]
MSTNIPRYSLAFAVLASLSATSAAAATNMAVVGKGAESCGDFIAAAQGSLIGKEKTFIDRDGIEYPTKIDGFIEWGFGYITAALLQHDLMSIPNWSMNSFDLYLRNYCNAHPTKPFMHAVQHYLSESGIHSGK